MKIDPLHAAKSFATYHHVHRKGQLYGPLPYTHHLAKVEEVIVRFCGDDLALRTAAWLHDAPEDTDATVRDVEEAFGEEVGALVSAVTNEPGPNRKTRAALTYPKIRAAGPRATALKLADRIANVSNGGAAVEMYRKEHDGFKHGLGLYNYHAPDGDTSYVATIAVPAMIGHLDKLLESAS